MTDYLKFLVKRHFTKFLLLHLLLIYTLSLFPVSAQNDTIVTTEQKQGTQKQDISLFGSNEILNVSLYLDLAGFMKKNSKNDSFEADMIINPGKVDSINKKIRLSYRGILRYDLCSFPR